MPTAASRASLMDDVNFVAALDRFDDRPVARVNALRASPDALHDLGDVWEPRAAFYEPTPAPAPVVTRAPSRSRASEREQEPDLDYADYAPPLVEDRNVVRDVAGFLLLMALGGAAAMLMFYERVAQLLIR